MIIPYRSWIVTFLPRICLSVVALALIAYLGSMLALFAYQRQLVFLPTKMESDVAPSSFGLPDTRDVRLRTSDGETLDAWFRPPRADGDLFLVFHGTGGDLGSLAGFLRDLATDGSGFLAIDYRGYGRSTGKPSELGLMRDGEAAYSEASRLGYLDNRIVVLGESLGTSVAIAVAKAHSPFAVVLDSAFASAVDIAAARYWMFPISLMMLDRFDTKSVVGDVVAPKLFIHGGRDDAIDPANGRQLYEAARQPKTFILLPNDGHLALWRPDALAEMRDWLKALPKLP